MRSTQTFVECGRGSWAIREVVGSGGSWGWGRRSRHGKGIKFSRRGIRRASELGKGGVAVGLEEGVIRIFDRNRDEWERERGERGKSGDGVAHGKEDAGEDRQEAGIRWGELHGKPTGDGRRRGNR